MNPALHLPRFSTCASRSPVLPRFLLSLFTTLFALPALRASNLIVNPGFETDLTASGWALFGTDTSVTTADKHSGSNALDIKDDSTSTITTTVSGAMAELSTPLLVDENKSYVLSFWVKCVQTTAGTGPFVQLTQSDSSGNSVTTNLPIAQTNAWVQYKYIIGPSGAGADVLFVPNVHSLQIAFFAAGVPASAEGEILLDDVALDDTGNLLSNADFSSSTDSYSWTWQGYLTDTSQTIEVGAFGGKTALHMVDTSTSSTIFTAVYQRCDHVETSQLYTIELDGYLLSGSTQFVIRQNGSDGTNLEATAVTISGAQWNHYSRTIGPEGSGADIIYATGVAEIMISLYGGHPNTATGEAYYTNVVFRPAGQLIENGGFEDGTSGWVTTGSRATGQLVEINTTDTYLGSSQSLHMRDLSTTASCSLSRYAPVIPSTSYTVSASAKNSSLTNPATIEITEMTALGSGNYKNVSGTGMTHYLQFASPSPSSPSWVSQSPPAIVTSSQTTALRVQLFAGDNSTYTHANAANPASMGDVLYDAISVVGPTGDVLLKGSFNQGTAGWDETELEFDGIEISSTPDVTHSGIAALKIYDNSTTDFGAVHQEVKVMPTGAYYLSFWARVANSGEGGYAILRQLNSDRETVMDTTITIPNTTWTNYAMAVGTNAGTGGVGLNSATRYLLIMFYSAEDPAMTNKATVYVDDVSLSPAAPLPTWSSSPSALVCPVITVQSTSNPFYDSFSGGDLYERWVTDSGSPLVSTAYAKSPPYSLRLGGGDSVERALNLTGYLDGSISISYNRKIGNFGSGDTGYVDWYDGTTWHNLEPVTGTSSDWVAKSFALPSGSGAATANFRLRLRVVGSSSDYCYFDDVQVAGAPSLTDSFRAPPMIGIKQAPWLGDYLVHAHSLMPLSTLVNWEVANAPRTMPMTLMDEMSAAGAKVVTAHVHTGDEGYWYPTGSDFALGAVEDPLVTPSTRDIVDEYATNATAPYVGLPVPALRFIGYHWVHSDRYALLNHPEWASRDFAGHLVDTARGWALSFSTPYRKYVQEVLTYEAGKAFDGFYFDQFDFAYRTGEQTPQLIDLFYAKNPTLSLPTNNDPTTESVKALVKISQQVVDSSFYQITTALRAVDPQFAVITAEPNEFTNAPYTFGSADTAAAADTPKIEMTIPLRSASSQTPDTTTVTGGVTTITPPSPDSALPFQVVQLSLAQVMARDAARKLPHTWDTRRDKMDTDPGYLQAMVGLAATNGFYMNFQTLQTLPAPYYFETSPPGLYSSAIQYGNLLSPDLRGRSYLTWAAVYVSEHVRSKNNAWPALNSTKTGYVGAAYGQYAWPIFGAVQTLQEQHVPWGVITDGEVALGEVGRTPGQTVPPPPTFANFPQFANITVIVVPHWTDLTSCEKAVLTDWQTAGGHLVTQMLDGTLLDATSLHWEDPGAPGEDPSLIAQPTLFTELWNAITNNGSLLPPIQVVSPSNDPSFKRTLAGFMRTTNGTVVVSLLNSVDWMDVRSESWQTLDTNGNQLDSNGTLPAHYDAEIIVHGGYTPVWAKLQPSNTSLTITSSGTDKIINVTGISVHAAVILDDED